MGDEARGRGVYSLRLAAGGPHLLRTHLPGAAPPPSTTGVHGGGHAVPHLRTRPHPHLRRRQQLRQLLLPLRRHGGNLLQVQLTTLSTVLAV